MKLKRLSLKPLIGLTIALCCLSACASPSSSPHPEVKLKAVTVDVNRLVTGQTVYVPTYAYIYTEDQKRSIELSTTLSIRNTDLNYPIILTAVSYHDTNGKLIKKYLKQPVELAPLASTAFVVERTDVAGGVGASFIVEWAAEQQVSTPVIESIMINTMGNQGISFVSPGRVIKTLSAPAKTP